MLLGLYPTYNEGRRTYEKLESKEFFIPIGPTPNAPEDKRSAKYDINACFGYHHGKWHRIGHHIGLKRLI